MLLTSHDPTAAEPSWTATRIPGQHQATGVACASATACVVETADDAYVSDPLTGALQTEVGAGGVTVSCPAATFCLAVGNQVATVYGLQGKTFEPVGFSFTHDVGGGFQTACPSAGLCLFGVGDVVRLTTDPEEDAWRSVAGPTEPAALACATTVRVCIALSPGSVTYSSDPVAGEASWGGLLLNVAMTSGSVTYAATCPTTTCIIAEGAEVLDLSVTPVPARPTTEVAVTGTNEATYLADGPTAPTGPHELTALNADLQNDSVPAYMVGAIPPAVAALPGSGPWPAETAVIHAADGGGVTAHIEAGGWFRLAGGACLGVGATVVRTTLQVVCEGTGHVLYTAGTALPLTSLSRLTPWVARGGTLRYQPAVALVGTRELVAVVGTSGRVWTMEPGYTSLAATALSCAGAPALAAGPDSTATLVCRDATGALQSSTRSAGGSWSKPVSLGGRLVGQAGIAIGAAGPTYAGEGTDGALWTRTATTGWVTQGGRLEGGASIAQTS